MPKPALALGELHVIGATTLDEYTESKATRDDSITVACYGAAQIA